jgi:hypothetical protein
MGGLLLKRKNDEGTTKTTEPKVLTEKMMLKQKVLTEEPYLDLFRVRKNRLERPVVQCQPIKKVGAIKFSLKFDDQTGHINKSTSQKHHIVNGRRTRWDVRDPHQESVSIVLEASKKYPAQGASHNIICNETGIKEKISIAQDTSHNRSVNIETSVEGEIDDNDDNYSIDSLQSDDDVLGPWIELGMIDPTPSKPEDDRPMYADCQQCTENSCTGTVDRDPFQTVNVCSNCQAEWKEILDDFSIKVHTLGKNKPEEVDKSASNTVKKKAKAPENSVSKQSQPSPNKLSNSTTSVIPNRSPVAIKKARGVNLSIPPTKSRQSQKTKSKINVDIDKRAIKASTVKDTSEDHITTGAFMTRKTAKTLADPEFGFYPNPHGFIRHQRVEVLNINGHWYRGTLEMMKSGKVMVQYDDWDDQEWIIMESRRLRALSKEDEEQITSSQQETPDEAATSIDDAEDQGKKNQS